MDNSNSQTSDELYKDNNFLSQDPPLGNLILKDCSGDPAKQFIGIYIIWNLYSSKKILLAEHTRLFIICPCFISFSLHESIHKSSNMPNSLRHSNAILLSEILLGLSSRLSSPWSLLWLPRIKGKFFLPLQAPCTIFYNIRAHQPEHI